MSEKYIYGIPTGGDDDPRIQRIIFATPNEQRTMPPPPDVMNNPVWVEQMKEQTNQMKARTAMIVADIRQRDAELFRNALAELRMAMGNYKISEGDTGTGERPAIDTSFDEINQGKLQTCYLNVTERYVKYIDHICKHDMGIDMNKKKKKSLK